MKLISPVLFLLFWLGCLTTLAQTSQPYGSNHGKYITIFHTKIYYEEYGKGPPLLMLHGGAGSIQDFQKVLPELSKHYHIIAPDSPGHGRSEQADSLGYQLMANYFSKFIDDLKLDNVYIIGWSDGGNTALILAADRPNKIKRIMVSGANATTEGLRDKGNGSSGFTPEYVEKESKEWLAWYQKLSPQKDQWKKFVNDSRKMWLTPIAVPETKLKMIKCPTLVVMGDKDIITLEHGQYIHNTLRGSELFVVTGSGHNTFNLKPELMTKLALDFFGKK